MKMSGVVSMFLAVIFLFGPSYSFSSASQLVGSDIIQKYDLHIKGTSSTEEVLLPHELTGPNWGLKQSVLKRTGFELSPYAGQRVLLIRYDLVEKYYQTTNFGTESYDLSLWVVAKGHKALGAFVTCRWPHGLIPGVFAVNDSSIKLPLGELGF
ncbi:DUF4830 domain-containing protein [Geomonas edaphica]|uniref:DUF4830 domain-containing protein n=1 Tax=Geomonas edaphica TaxID=2570226 RepID=UPI0010A871B6|nr:DUF4830 domain-containing protein [Geomonas edaphica]